MMRILSRERVLFLYSSLMYHQKYFLHYQKRPCIILSDHQITIDSNESFKLIRGITPIDAALEMMGLHQAQALMQFIFVEAWVGRIIFVLGFILSLGAGLEKGNFKATMIFVFMFFVLWFLLVAPCVKASAPVSAMESQGYPHLKTVEVLKKNGYGQVMVNPVLDGVVRWIDALITGVTGVLDRVGGCPAYLKSPFLMVKTSLLVKHRLEQGITDHALQIRTVYFYQDFFWPALRGVSAAGLWPGDASAVALYKEEGRKVWETLRDDLYAMLDADTVVSHMFDKFYDGKTNKDLMVRDLLQRELLLRPARYTHMVHGSDVYKDQKAIRDLFTSMSLNVLQAVPFIQGWAIGGVLAAFPFGVAWAMLLRHVEPLLIWVAVLFSVKSWTLGWAVLDKISWVWFVMHKEGQGVSLWQMSLMHVLVVIGIMVTVVVMTFGMVMGVCKIQTRREQ